MRQIEQDMLEAIKYGRDWRKDNTEVMVDEGFKAVFLHRHHIATVYPQGEVSVNTATLSDWPTRTTVSRLRALGVDVYTRKGDVILNNEIVTRTD